MGDIMQTGGAGGDLTGSLHAELGCTGAPYGSAVRERRRGGLRSGKRPAGGTGGGVEHVQRVGAKRFDDVSRSYFAHAIDGPTVAGGTRGQISLASPRGCISIQRAALGPHI